LYIENDEYVDIGMLGSGSHGVAVYGTHDELFSFLLLVNYYSSGGSGDCNDCIPPTLGINKRGVNMVTDGFSFNGNYVNVEYFHTPFPLISTETGVSNTMTLKIFENHGIGDITNVRVGLGIPNLFTPITQAEVFLNILFTNGNVTDIEINDDSILIQNVTAFTDTVKCTELSNKEECLEVTMVYYYRESPMHNIVAVSPVDDNGLSWPVYFNDGIKVEGDSLNPPQVRNISGIQYTETDKFKKTWIDNEGIEYEMTNVGWMDRTTPWPTYVCNDTPLDQINGGYGRDNCHFRALTSLWPD